MGSSCSKERNKELYQTDVLTSILPSLEQIQKIHGLFGKHPDEFTRQFGLDPEKNTSLIDGDWIVQLDTFAEYEGRLFTVALFMRTDPNDYVVLDVGYGCTFESGHEIMADVAARMLEDALGFYGEPVTVHMTDQDSLIGKNLKEVIEDNRSVLLREWWNVGETDSVEVQFEVREDKSNVLRFLIHSYKYPKQINQ